MIIKNEHFYNDIKRSQIRHTFKNFKKRKSMVPYVLEDNYNGMLYRIKKHYFQHYEV